MTSNKKYYVSGEKTTTLSDFQSVLSNPKVIVHLFITTFIVSVILALDFQHHFIKRFLDAHPNKVTIALSNNVPKIYGAFIFAPTIAAVSTHLIGSCLAVVFTNIFFLAAHSIEAYVFHSVTMLFLFRLKRVTSAIYLIAAIVAVWFVFPPLFELKPATFLADHDAAPHPPITPADDSGGDHHSEDAPIPADGKKPPSHDKEPPPSHGGSHGGDVPVTPADGKKPPSHDKEPPPSHGGSHGGDVPVTPADGKKPPADRNDKPDKHGPGHGNLPIQGEMLRITPPSSPTSNSRAHELGYHPLTDRKLHVAGEPGQTDHRVSQKHQQNHSPAGRH